MSEGATGLIAAIEAGAGVAILPQGFACSAGPRLKLIPLSPAPEPLIIGAVWSPKSLTPAARLFLTCAAEPATNLNPRR